MWLLAAVLVAAGIIRFAERRFGGKGERRDRAARLLAVRAEAILELSLESGDLRVECVRKDGDWFMQYPVRTKADAGEINRILSILESLPRVEVITRRQRAARDLTDEHYGLDTPRGRVAYTDGLGKTQILIGREAPVGDVLYVRLASSTDIIATAHDALAIIPGTAEILRDRTVMPGDGSRTTRLEIQRTGGGFIQLMRKDGDWFIQQPLAVRADNARISAMLDTLFGLQVEMFVWDPPLFEDGPVPDTGLTARDETYGLSADEAAARIRVWAEDDQVGRELILGKTADEEAGSVYAKCRDIDSIYAVDGGIVDSFSIDVNAIRDRRVFRIAPDRVRAVCFRKGDGKLLMVRSPNSGWQIVEPVAWKADDRLVSETVMALTSLHAESFLEGDTSEEGDAASASPLLGIRLLAEAPEQAPVGATADEAGDEEQRADRDWLLVDSIDESGTASVRFEHGPSVLRVPGKTLAALAERATDALVYRDRTVLAVPRESVRRISLYRNDAEQTVVRDDEGAWRAQRAGDLVSDIEVIEDILLLAANLRAVRIESHNPRNLEMYGIDRPGMMLTLGLTGEEGIQKSIMMGFKAKTDGIYAMVQGQDVVFVLANPVVDRLTRDLIGAGRQTE